MTEIPPLPEDEVLEALHMMGCTCLSVGWLAESIQRDVYFAIHQPGCPMEKTVDS